MSDSALIKANQRLCSDCIALLETLDASLYHQTPAPHSSIGSHVRHIIEFYQCLLDDVQNTQHIDYDQRPRNARLSSDMPFAIENLRNIQQLLEAVVNLPQTVSVNETVSLAEQQPFHIKSSVSRELLFLHAHTLHHFSSIKAIAFALGVTLDAHFGKAPSTIMHEKAQSSR